MPPIHANGVENEALQQRLVQAARQLLSASGAPGAVVALLLDGQPILLRGFGFRDTDRRIAINPEARFYIYSVTKSLVALAILKLVEQERLALDDPVQRYMPGLPLSAPVTIRQLLSHTGGIPDYSALPAYFEAVRAQPGNPWTTEEFLAATLRQGPLFAPGTGWSYSNIGYLLLRQLIEAVTGDSLAAALRESIFEPLGLERTIVASSLADAGRLTPGYSTFFSGADSLQDVRSVYHPGWVSHGVVISSAGEVARIFEALSCGQLIRPQLVAEMLDPVLVPVRHTLFQQPAYGLGLMLDPQSRHGLIAGHGGGGPGYSAGALHLPNARGRRITSVALANDDRSDLGLELAFTVASLLADSLTS